MRSAVLRRTWPTNRTQDTVVVPWPRSDQAGGSTIIRITDLALGLRVSRRAVLLRDAEDRQEVFERVAAAAEAGRIDAALIGQSRGGNPTGLGRGQEGRDDVVSDCSEL